MRRRLVDTRHGQMHVRMSEGRGRPLVALHMSPLSSAMWIPLMTRLARPVIAPDRIGFGYSDPPPSALTMSAYAAATLDALDVLGLETFDLLGEHTGSVEAVEITHRTPNRVQCLGLVAVPAYTDGEIRERLAVRGRPGPTPAEDGSHLTELWLRRLKYRSAPYDLDVLHRNTVEELASAGAHRAYRAVFTYPMKDRLTALNRAVVVFAPHDDLITQTERSRSWLPAGSVYVDLPDLGMDIFEVAVGRMAALVDQHLGESLCPT